MQWEGLAVPLDRLARPRNQSQWQREKSASDGNQEPKHFMMALLRQKKNHLYVDEEV
jgi:hypothetical protein